MPKFSVPGYTTRGIAEDLEGLGAWLSADQFSVSRGHECGPLLRQTGFWVAYPRAEANFVEPMLLQRADMLPSGRDWIYGLKLDGFRAEAINSGGTVRLRSRNDRDFNPRFPSVAEALAAMPDETVIDGEIVALDKSGRPSFNALQNCGAGAALIIYYVFDVMILAGKDVMDEPLATRRDLLRQRVLKKLGESIRESPELNATLPDLIRSVKAQSLEGLVAKRRDSRYEPGQRSGAWQKMRISQGQDFLIAGYTPSAKNFDAIIFGYYDAGTLMYAGRTRNGFTPSSRHQLFKRFKGLEMEKCPFANLPEARSGRWGEGLTAEKMKSCRWLQPVLVAQFQYVEWTPDAHLRHSRFMGLRDDKAPQDSPARGVARFTVAKKWRRCYHALREALPSLIYGFRWRRACGGAGGPLAL